MILIIRSDKLINIKNFKNTDGEQLKDLLLHQSKEDLTYFILSFTPEYDELKHKIGLEFCDSDSQEEVKYSFI